MNNRKFITLLVIGILTIVASQIVTHYITLTDALHGAFIGVGVGFMSLALILKRFKSAG